MSRKMFVKFASLTDTLCMKVNSKTDIQCLTFDSDGVNTLNVLWRKPNSKTLWSDDLNDLLVAVHVAGAVGVAEVDKGGVDDDLGWASWSRDPLSTNHSSPASRTSPAGPPGNTGGGSSLGLRTWHRYRVILIIVIGWLFADKLGYSGLMPI